MNYFITAIPYYPENGQHLNDRCFGYYPTLDDAKESVLQNKCDLHEALYNYIVIEEIGYGIHPEPTERKWFQWQTGWEDGWVECEKPKWSEGIINWAIG